MAVMLPWYKKTLILCLLVTCGGCAQFNRQTIAEMTTQERQFAAALQFIHQGNEQSARDLLEKVVLAPGLHGVTDDALFRLALLRLRDDGNKGLHGAYTLLARLDNEYPKSIWTYQAAPLSTYLLSVQKLFEQQRENKALRGLNYHLIRENKELNLNIEKLKNLDIELDKKIRR